MKQDTTNYNTTARHKKQRNFPWCVTELNDNDLQNIYNGFAWKENNGC